MVEKLLKFRRRCGAVVQHQIGFSADIGRALRYSEGACRLTEFDRAGVFQQLDSPLRVFALKRGTRPDARCERDTK